MSERTANDNDPWLWLEDVAGDAALAWVRGRNAITEAHLGSDPRFAATRAATLEVLDSREQIPHVARRGDWLYNFWRDDRSPRGLWRRCSRAACDSSCSSSSRERQSPTRGSLQSC